MVTQTESNLDIYKTYEELFDSDVMEQLLNDQGISKTVRVRLNAYKKRALHSNCVAVSYNYGKGCGPNKIGRVFCVGYTGLQSFPRYIRDSLTAKHYWDLDMENAHYWIMRNFCEKNGLKCPAIDYYCDNREECLSKVSSDRTIAKTAYLKIAYGGNLKLSDINCEDDGVEPEGDISHIKACEKDIATVIKYVKGAYPDVHKLAVQQCKRKKEWADKKGKKIYWNADFTALANVLQTEEHKSLEAIEEYLLQNGRRLDIPIHDGGRVLKLDNEVSFPQSLIDGAEKAIKDKVGYTLKLKIKPLPTYVAPTKVPTDIIDDEYAARFFVEQMGDNIIRQGEEIFIYDLETGMWSNKDDIFRKALFAIKNKMIFKEQLGAIVRIHNYGGSDSKITAMKKQIPACIPYSTIIDPHKSKYCLLFKNGWYDMVLEQFNYGFEMCKDKFFIKGINRDFVEKRDYEMEAKVNKIIFEDPFVDPELGPYLKNGLSRAIAGCIEDKTWWGIVGPGDCGKGCLSSCFKNTFEDYVGDFNMNCFLINSKSGADEAKKLSWMLPLQGCRLIIANEARMGKYDKYDGNMLKAVASGGDPLKARLNFQDEVTFIPTFTALHLANDLVTYYPNDQPLKNRISTTKYEKSFVTGREPKNEYELPGDPDLKQKIKSEEFINAFFWIIMDGFMKGVKLPKPAAVVAEIDDLFEIEETKMYELIKENYTIEKGNEDVYVTSRHLNNYLKENGVVMSENKIGRELTKLGFKRATKKIDGKCVKVWLGIQE